MRRRLMALVIVGMVVFGLPVATAGARIPASYKNCTNLNKKYPHGVGKFVARDHTSGRRPVTNFKRSTKLYRIAMSYNSRTRPRQGRHRLRESVTRLERRTLEEWPLAFCASLPQSHSLRSPG